jgi:hypothetical protein
MLVHSAGYVCARARATQLVTGTAPDNAVAFQELVASVRAQRAAVKARQVVNAAIRAYAALAAARDLKIVVVACA